jgi:UDP-N-acetylmuramoyl-L-alanyl-D-glutamate--2,6-diaminopimelate ligase
MKLKHLIDGLEYKEVIGTIDKEINNLQHDSREVDQHDIFVAISGHDSDGHDYIESAVSFGADVVVSEKSPDLRYDNVTFIVVENSRVALAKLATNYYKNPSQNLKMIGVTGTNGKTSVTFLIKNLLKKQGQKSAIIGTTGIYIDDEKVESTLTTPDSVTINKILRQVADKGIEYVIMEVSSHALDQNRAAYLDFDIALFTNITHDHLDYHQTFEAYSEAKKLLFDNLKSDGIAIVNVDDAGYKDMISDTEASVSLVGWDVNANYQIKNDKISNDGSQFDIEHNDKSVTVHSPLIAQFNIMNLSLSLVAVSKILQEELLVTATGLSTITTAPGRMERVNLSNGAIAIVDYAHTPDALEKAAKVSKLMSDKTKGKLIVVFGCGGNRDKSKRPKMAEAAEKYADRIIVTDDNPRTENREKIYADIEKGLTKAGNYVVIGDRKEAIVEAVKISNSGDIILIAGKGHENYQIIDKEKIHFDDKEVVLGV